jgi:hypothetical protein
MSDLWTVSLMFCGSDRQVNMVYQSEDAAREAFGRWTKEQVQEEFPVHIEADQYGTTVCLFGGGPLEAVMMQDAGRAADGGIELGLLQARSQAKAQRLASADPMLQRSVVPVQAEFPRPFAGLIGRKQ